jgi:hypothetical protein
MASDPCTSIILTDGCGKSPRNSGEGDGRRPRTVPAWRGSSSRRAAAAPGRCRRPSRDPAAAAPVGGAFAAGPDREWCPGLMESGRKSIPGRETGHRGRFAREPRTIRPCADDSTTPGRHLRAELARSPPDVPRSAGGHSRRSRGPGGDRPAAAAGQPGRGAGCLFSESVGERRPDSRRADLPRPLRRRPESTLGSRLADQRTPMTSAIRAVVGPAGQ